ncbi:hypothetical protein KW784_01030 [Candidatus Parcubacteria bacterium]|nr:hypothetical protein [Candidatus Parcubacteria bacterium]
MPKNMDDVVPPERRKSIRNIPIPEGRRKADRAPLDGVRKTPARARLQAELPPEPPAPPPLPPRHIRPGGGPRKGLWYSGLAAGIVLLFAILSVFKGAMLSYVPRSAPLSFSGEAFSAYKSAGTGLPYSVVKLSGDKGVAVAATGEQDVARKASGIIIVYNDASEQPQALIENTRFESADGKVYRIAKAISIPGKKGSTPGSLEATVYADQPGASYNIPLTDFTVPGLKGTPRFDTVYARSKTAMTGGFAGKEKSVSAADLAAAKAKLQESLSQELVAKAEAEVPGDFILFPALSSVSFEDLPQSPASGSQVTVNVRGNLYGIMFKKADLALALSLGKAARAAQDPVEIADYSSLQVSFASTTPADLLAATKVDFKVAGQALLVWKTDEVALKADLAGRKKSELPQILKNYPTVASASAAIRPFWKSAFPDDPSQISLKRQSP